MVDSLLRGLFPAHCALCGLPAHRDLPLCRACEAELPRNRACCPRCAIPLADAAHDTEQRLCGQCLCQPPAFHRAVCPWLYGEQLAFLIHRWKFGGQTRFTGLLAELWLQQLEHAPEVDLLLPVPLHWRRLWRRGFNQSDLLCRQLRARWQHGAPPAYEPRAVCRSRATAAQSGMDAARRVSNLRGAFTVRRPCDNLRVAIVDDVLTTGATARALASALAAAGASHIEVWCLARTPAPG